jgi:nucleotide-binding universal stress UspA family protein
MFQPKNILVPVDFSEFSVRALSQAFDIAGRYGSTIYVLHVVGVMRQCSVDYCLDASSIDAIRKEAMESARSMMDEQIKALPPAPDIRIVAQVREGVAYEEILKEQEARNVDLIVIASHGKTGLLSHFGSVTDHVARSAHCPVLIVKGK